MPIHPMRAFNRSTGAIKMISKFQLFMAHSHSPVSTDLEAGKADGVDTRDAQIPWHSSRIFVSQQNATLLIE